MVQETVEQTCRQDRVGEDVLPASVALVAGLDDGFSGLVTAADDLKEESGVGLFQG